MMTDEPVDAAIARARCVFPVPGGPCRSIPRGGLSPTLSQFQFGVWPPKEHTLTEPTK